MRGAEDAIRDGDLGEALNEQAEALDNLRRGLRALNDQRRAENSQSDGNGQGDTAADGQSGRGDENDPLGRSRNGQENGGSALSGTQDQIGDLDRFEEVNRLRDQLLEKLEERERPNYELDYFDRLLERFK